MDHYWTTEGMRSSYWTIELERKLLIIIDARSESRTRTGLRPGDFKSPVSTIPPSKPIDREKSYIEP